MRTRKYDWLDAKEWSVLYGLQVMHRGQWHNVMLNGAPALFKTAEARDDFRAAFKKSERARRRLERSPEP